ncbi:TetR/AcrR family transcriptional regulator [Leucobacter sp. W1478]|uniref:TetR/AcrR family transcriptional regulator n=1 Tax=Leucobacter sp. W1478 TaxID=3439065 RepID=UPI003F2E2525
MPAEMELPERALAPGRRDPHARRLAILNAAAALIVEVGPARLTHRMVATRAQVALGSTTQYFASIDELREAALHHLATEFEDGLREAEQALSDFDAAPERFAELMHQFLSDRRQVHADIALVTSAATDPRLRAIALRWYDRLVELLTAHIGSERAEIAAIFYDGAVMHASLHDEPLSREQLARAFRAITSMPLPPAPS